MTTMSSWRGWLFALCAVLTLWSIAGLVANPDFTLGDNATAVQVLGVDFNGWHAVAGLLLWPPGLLAASRDILTVAYTWYALVASLTPAIWAVFDERPAWVFYFPNPTGDIVLHVATAAALALILVLRHQTRTSAPA